MTGPDGFSQRLELPNIPAGPGVCIIEDENGVVLQIVESKNIRRRVGELLDSEGHIAVHGPKIYAEQRQGQRIFVRWIHTSHYKELKKQLISELGPRWKAYTDAV
jgi:excinuclease UvrABC nuclease subunit